MSRVGNDIGLSFYESFRTRPYHTYYTYGYSPLPPTIEEKKAMSD